MRSSKLFIISLPLSLCFGMLCGGAMTPRESLIHELPDWVHLSDTDMQITVNADEQESIGVALKKGCLTLGNETFEYKSGSELIVADIFIFDPDRDGRDDVMLHVWKRGSFGEHRPFWLEDVPDDHMTEHLFIYSYDTRDTDRLKARWMSSQMPVEGEYITIEDNDVVITSPDSTVTRWRWESWGLTKTE